MRVINADALKESLKELKAEGTNRKYVQGLQDAIDGYFPQIIDDEPTIDAEPVRHGRWVCVEAEPERVWCDNCKTIYYSSDLLNIEADDEKVNFCPNCGARMDGDEDD